MIVSHDRVECPYQHGVMDALGFIEHQDDLGIYMAETFICPTCGYRLEREPVYIADNEDTPPDA